MKMKKWRNEEIWKVDWGGVSYDHKGFMNKIPWSSFGSNEKLFKIMFKSFRVENNSKLNFQP